MKPYLITLLVIALAAGQSLRAGNLQPAGSFESQEVSGPQSLAGGADPTNAGAGPGWTTIRDRVKDGVEIGLTNAQAHEGKQSLYVKFTNAASPFVGAEIVSEPIPVAPGTVYTVSIWGRQDETNPIKDSSTAVKAVVEYLSGGSPVGEKEYVGSPLGSDASEPLFNSADWQQLAGTVTAPEGATHLSVRWVWQITEPASPVSGTVYFDDAEVTAQ